MATDDTIAQQAAQNAFRATPLALANTFIQHHGQAEGIQHMKLQKLCYYTHGWWLALRPQPSQPFLTERPQVWKYGPVFNSLYNVLKPYGKRPIKALETDNPFEDPDVIENNDVIRLVNWIWDRYGQYTAEELSDRTHKEGTPWRQIAEEHNYRVSRNFPIDDERIRAYFLKQRQSMASPTA